MQRLRRLLRLLELLQSGQYYDVAKLAAECGVSRRTIFRDLALLQKSGVQVRFDGTRQGYTVPGRTFLPPADLAVDETLSLLNLCAQLGGEQGIPFRQSARSAALKLASNLPASLRDGIEELAQSVVILQDARNPLTAARDDYEMMLEAFQQRRRVQLLYDSLFEGRHIATVLSPYSILFKRRSWYVIGRSSMHRAIRTFNVGRILHAELLEKTYHIPRWFRLESQLRNAWWLIRGERSHRVVVRFSKLVARNVAEVQWHRTQHVFWNEDGSLLFRARVDGLNEIVWWVLGYGDEAEVLAPEVLRQDIRRRVNRMRKMYAEKR